MSIPLSHLKHVTTWLTDLANLTAGTAPLADAKAKIAALAGAIAADFPDPRAFGKESVYAISRELRFFPAYADLHKLLSAWWQENRPADAALPGVEDPSLTQQDRAMLRVWLNHRAEGFAHCQGADFRDRMAVSLDALRKDQTVRVFDYVCRTDREAEGIALRRGWLRDTGPMEERLRRDWGSLDDAGALAWVDECLKTAEAGHPVMAQVQLNAVRAAIERYAPERLHLLPERLVAARTERDPTGAERTRSVQQQVDALAPSLEDTQRAAAAFEERHGRKPGELSAAQLAELRKSNPTLKHALDQQAKAKATAPPRSMWDPLPNAKAGDVKIEPVPNAVPGTGNIQPLDNAPANDRAPQRAAAAATPPPPTVRFPWHDDEVVT